MLARGQVVDGRYRLVEQIGEGGMGSVWLAFDEPNKRDVALKVLHKTLVGDRDAIARFHNEAKTAARLDHPNICSVSELGEFEGAPFLVMPRLRGENLAERLTRERTVPPIPAVEILLDILSALAAAHAQGILHRDLKPENIYLAHEEGRIVPKILDFGVSKIIGDDAERVRMTRTGALVGTPAYMSPEQALGSETIDTRSDVWAAGVLLYEMLSGKLPFEAANYNAMLVKIATERPRPIKDLLPALDDGLASVVHRALAHDRAERYESAGALSEALRGWLDGAPVKFTAQRVAMPTPHVVTTPMSWAESSSPPDGTHVVTLSQPGGAAGRRTWLLPGVLAVVLGFAGLIIARGAQRSGHAGAPPTPLLSLAGTPDAGSPSREHQMQVLGLPADARVEINGTAVLLPAMIRADENVRIAITAPGFEPWTQTVVPTGDVALTYEGRRTPAPTPPPVVADAGAGPARVENTSGTHRNSRHTQGSRRGRGDAGVHLERGVAGRPDF